MQVTKRQLKKIINEELQKILQEQTIAGSGWEEYPQTLARPQSPYEPVWDEDSPPWERTMSPGWPQPGSPHTRKGLRTQWPEPPYPGAPPWPDPTQDPGDLPPDTGASPGWPVPEEERRRKGWPDPERPGSHPEDIGPPELWDE